MPRCSRWGSWAARCARSARRFQTSRASWRRSRSRLGRAGINITDMSLAPEVDNRTGTVALWVRSADAERTIGLVAGLGYPAG